MSAPRPRYRIELEARPDAVPAAIRLKRLLKITRRGYGLKCLAAEKLADEQPRPPVTEEVTDK